MTRSDDGQLPDRIRALAVPVAEALEIELLEVEVKGHAGRRVVNIVADAAELDAEVNLDIDTIAKLSRQLGKALDEDDVVPGAYTLEVTSPGADRPLRSPRDFVRNLGRDVKITRPEGSESPTVTGSLVAATDDDITLQVDGADVVVPFADLDHGKVVLPW